MNQANLNNSSIDGDFIQGSKYVSAPSTNLEKAIDLIVQKHGKDEQLVEIFEELAEFLTDNPDREIIGPEKKLERGNRGDLTTKAIRLKNKFDRKITKKQLSPIVQKVHLQVLSSIISAFDLHVRPLIIAGASKDAVDSAIHEQVILPAHQGIIRFNDMITTEDVRGMLYFLTGKCHLVWSAEC